jgi:hypothetical protein
LRQTIYLTNQEGKPVTERDFLAKLKDSYTALHSHRNKIKGKM